MIVPTINRTIGIEAQGTPAARIEPVTPAASGAEIGQAVAGLGKTVEGMGGLLQQHIQRKIELDEEQQVNDRAQSLLKNIDEATFGANGFIQRKGVNAKGIVTGNDPDKISDDSFEGIVSKNMTEAMKGLNARQASYAQKLFNAHIEPRREQVLKHSVAQGKIAEQEGIAATITTDANTYAVDPMSPQAAEFYHKAVSQLEDLKTHQGMPPEAIALAKTEVADQFLKQAAEANLEHNPDMVKKALEDLPASPAMKAKIQAMYDGKMVDSGVQLMRTPQKSAELYNPDQTYNAQKVADFANKFATEHKFSDEQRTQLLNQTRSEAGRINSAIAQQREQNKAQWHNNVIRDFNTMTKSNPMTAQDLLINKYVRKDKTDFSGYSEIDTAKKSDFINGLFADANKARESALAYLSPSQKAALSEVEIMADGKLGKIQIQLAGMDEKQSAKDVYMNIIKQKVAGSNMTHNEIVGYANDLFKSVTVKPGWIFDTKQPQYQIEAEKGQAYSISFAELEKVYGRDMVQKAQAALGGGASPASVNEAIRRALKIPESKKPEIQKKGQPLQGFTLQSDIYRGNKI